MKSTALVILCSLMMMLSCQTPQETASPPIQAIETPPSDTFFHYSIWFAFVNKVFDGDLKVSELKANGDVGLGSFDLLDGEMVMLDGVPYRIREDGTVSIGQDDDEIVYANAAFFDTDASFTVSEVRNDEQLRAAINAQLPTPYFFYAFKVTGTFNTITLGGVPKQEKPFTEGLDVLIPNRPVFEGEDISGTMVGFYCPDFIGHINAAGYHFHFISDDRQMGGHVMAFEADGPLQVAYDKMTDYHFYLPDNEDYRNVVLDKEFQYGKN